MNVFCPNVCIKISERNFLSYLSLCAKQYQNKTQTELIKYQLQRKSRVDTETQSRHICRISRTSVHAQK
jgi:hypothetical protein